MPTLHWIGKEKIINHHLDVPYKVLDHQYGFTEKGKQKKETESGNMIIHGDNLEALKSLLPKYEGKIKCIYIDPPYNTGNEGWVYNDNVSHPKLQKWLGEIVGKESEDLTRHDKWLCMMYPRIKLLHRLLSNTGAIFISIDDHESASLKLLIDEVFGNGNFVSSLATVMNLKGNQDEFAFAGSHEYTYVYAKNKKYFIAGNLSIDEEDYESWDIDEIGYFKKGAPLRATGAESNRKDRPLMFYPILVKDGVVSTLPTHEFMKLYKKETATFDDVYLLNIKSNYQNMGYDFILPMEDKAIYGRWRWGYNDQTKFKLKSDVIVNYTKTGISLYKKQRPELGDLPSKKPKSLFYKPEYSSGNGTNQIKKIFLDKIFQTPKPLELIYDFLQIATNKDCLILDSFAGSGTTAHAVLNLNKQDGGNRKFILIELEDYADTITAERVKRVIQGYSDKEGSGGNFDYYTVGEPLFDDNHNLNELLPDEKIREYIWYSETRSNYEPQKSNTPFLGSHHDTGYYFMYDKTGLTTLDYEALGEYVKEKTERYVIYADNCLLPENFMRAKNIEFKKIPRNIARF